MLRWFRGRRKQKKTTGSQSCGEYGFNEEQDENLNYKDYHVYEEIADIPAHLCSHTSWGEGVPKHPPPRDGPYMVVPILEGGSFPHVDHQPQPASPGSVFTCALIGRRNYSISGNTETESSGVDLTYDLSDSQHYCPVEVNGFSSEKECGNLNSGKECGNLNSGKDKCVCLERDRPGHCRDTSLLASSDTGYEYDVSTSSEGDHTSYEFYLARIEQNLIHKCKIRELIHQVSPINEESDNESMTTESSFSMTSHSHLRHLVTKRDSDDEGALADYSESENSSGYYDSEVRVGFQLRGQCELARLSGSCDTCGQHSSESSDKHKHAKGSSGHKRCLCGGVSFCKAHCARTKGGTPEHPLKQHQHQNRSCHQQENRSRVTHHRQHSAERNKTNFVNGGSSSVPKHVHQTNIQSKTKCRKQTRDLNSGRCKSEHNSMTSSSENYVDEILNNNTNTDPKRSDQSRKRRDTRKTASDKGQSSGTIFPVRADDAEEYEYRDVYSGTVSNVRTRKSSLSNKVAKSRNFDSVDIYKSRASNNRLLSDLIINNYHERQLLFA